MYIRVNDSPSIAVGFLRHKGLKPSATGHESGECVALLLRPDDVKRDFS